MRYQDSFAMPPKPKEQKPKRILIIEQSESLGILYKSMLLQREYTILTVSCGKEALAKLDSFRPNMIVTADELLDMDSNQLRKQVSTQSSEIYIPILVLSAQKKTLFSSARPAMNANETLFIPFRIKDLRSSVQRLLGTEEVDDSNFYYPSNLKSSYAHPKKFCTAAN